MNLFSKPHGKHAHDSSKDREDSQSHVEVKAEEAVEGGNTPDQPIDQPESEAQVPGDEPESVEEPGDKEELVADGGDGGEASGQDGPHPDEAGDAEEGADGQAEDGAEAGDESHEGALVPIVAPLEDDGSNAFVAAGFGEIPAKKRRRGLKAFGITVGVIAAVLLVAYIVGAVVFTGRFLPNTKLGDHDLSLKSDAEVAELLEGIVSDYQLDVIGGGFAYRTTGSGIGLSVDANGIIAAMHGDENPWQWPLLILQPSHDESNRMYVSFKRRAYENDVKAAVEKYNETAKPPVNATIVYDEKSDRFVVQPEEAGTQLDAGAVLDAMDAAIEVLDEKLVLTDDELIQPDVLSTDEKLIEAAELASGMVSADLSLVMGGQPVGEVNGETLSEFITIDDDFQVVFKEEEMNAWVDSLAASFNTIGVERVYTRADGKEVVVPAGGSYGWEIDAEALKNAVLEGIKEGKASKIEVPCAQTAAVYNGVGQRDWGNRYLDVDITEQHVRFYGEDGAIIWEADFISGSPDGTHDTVPGTWYINNKESPSKLVGYEHGKKIYETNVTYWMPFEGNGIGFHDATWQPSFGGSMYANGYGSHGCVNLSYEAARTLYDIVQVGDVVVVHY